ncbi:MAG: hypothetical protein ACOH2F_03545 [Cellulomonas sp.]
MRTIKPEFWTDSTMVGLSLGARLLYIGTWNFAICHQGHLEDDVFRLKMQVFPGNDLDVQALLDELMAAGRIRRLVSPDGHTYLHIVRLSNHQKTDPRWAPSCRACKESETLTEALPSTPEHTGARESTPERGRALRSTGEHSEGWDGVGGDGMGGEGVGELPPSPASPSRTSEPAGFAEFWSEYPRKVGKDDARRAYARAVKRSSSAAVLLGAHRYAADPNLGEPTFIPHPAKWLNDGRWEDGPLVPRGNGRTTTDDRVRGGLDLAARLRTVDHAQRAQIGASS